MEKGGGKTRKSAFTDMLNWKHLHHQEKTKFFRSFKLAGVNVPIFTKLPPASPFLDLTMAGLYSPFLPLPGLSNMSRGLVLNVTYETESQPPQFINTSGC